MLRNLCFSGAALAMLCGASASTAEAGGPPAYYPGGYGYPAYQHQQRHRHDCGPTVPRYPPTYSYRPRIQPYPVPYPQPVVVPSYPVPVYPVPYAYSRPGFGIRTDDFSLWLGR